MKIFGLLGFPLSHSFSKTFFLEKFAKENITDCTYENFSFERAEDAVEMLKGLENLAGFNITIPHKRHILPFLDESSPVCNEIKSCNCIKVKDGKWIGHNTDVIGFSRTLTPLLASHHTRALIFGTGGASMAVRFVLEELGIAYHLVSRDPRGDNILTYDELDEEVIRNHSILINTTPLGMYPDTHKLVPINYGVISTRHLAYDLIYNPEETLFLKKAREHGATIKNGAEMLIIQAEESWKIWNS